MANLAGYGNGYGEARAVNQAAAQSAPRMQTQLQEAAARQESLFNTHHDLLNSLRERLEPIMRPSGPEASSGIAKEKEPLSSALTAGMNQFADHIQTMNIMVEDMLRRLDI